MDLSFGQAASSRLVRAGKDNAQPRLGVESRRAAGRRYCEEVIYFFGAEAPALAAEAAEAAGAAFLASSFFGASAAKAVVAKAAAITTAKSLFISGTFLEFE
jgi:hypothetical protein